MCVCVYYMYDAVVFQVILIISNTNGTIAAFSTDTAQRLNEKETYKALSTHTQKIKH